MIGSRAFITRDLRKKVFDFLDKKPDANIYELYFEFPTANKGSLKVYKSHYKKEIKLGKRELVELVKNLKLMSVIFKTKVKLLHKLSVGERQALQYIDVFIEKKGVI